MKFKDTTLTTPAKQESRVVISLIRKKDIFFEASLLILLLHMVSMLTVLVIPTYKKLLSSVKRIRFIREYRLKLDQL